jgi:hypothetical protein
MDINEDLMRNIKIVLKADKVKNLINAIKNDFPNAIINFKDKLKMAGNKKLINVRVSLKNSLLLSKLAKSFGAKAEIVMVPTYESKFDNLVESILNKK